MTEREAVFILRIDGLATDDFPPTLVRQSCIVEWTMMGSAAQGYRWQGAGCRRVTP